MKKRMADIVNGLRSEWDEAGDSRRAGASGQLQQSQGAHDHANLLYATTQQFCKLLLVLGRDINNEGGHPYPEYAPK